MSLNKIIGDFGEILVSKILTSKGHKVLISKYKKWGGEIDIITYKGNVLYFTEVKTRSVKSTEYNDSGTLDLLGLSIKKMCLILKCSKSFISEQVETGFISKKFSSQFDAYVVKILRNPINTSDFTSVEGLIDGFRSGLIKVLLVSLQNIDREIFN